MKKIIIGLLFICFQQVSVKAQTSVQIMSLYSIPMSNLIASDTSLMRLIIGFQVNNPGQASTAHFLFGSAIDSSDVLNLSANFINANGTYYLQIGSKQYPIERYDAQIEVVLTKNQYDSARFITLYVENLSNVKTTYLHTQLH